MKKRIILISAMTVFSIAGFAQGHSDMASQRLDRLSKELKLTPEQKEKMEVIQKEFDSQKKELGTNKDANQEALEALRKDKRTKMQEVLTPEQQKLMQEKQKANRAKNEEMRKELKAYHKEKIAPVLNEKRKQFDETLSKEEKATLDEMRNKVAALKEDGKNLREEFRSAKEKGEEIDKSRMQAFKAKRKATMEDVHNALKPIAQNHKDQLNEIKTSLEPKRAEWEKDMKVIRDKYQDDLQKEMHQKKMHDKKLKEEEKNKNHKDDDFKDMKSLKFLLLDPDSLEN